MLNSQFKSDSNLMQAAFAHYRAGQKVEAADLFDRMLSSDPEQLAAPLMRGIILAEGAEPDPAAAEAVFRKVLDLSPQNFLALNQIGQLRLAEGKLLDAVALFEQALAVNPNFAPVHNNLGVALHGLGRRSAALAAFDKALAIDPSFLAVRANRGAVLADLGWWDEAVPELRLVAAHSPTSAAVWCALGSACQQINALVEAEDACRRALAIDAKDVDAHVQLATVLDRAGRGDEALELFAEAARLHGVVSEPCLGAEAEGRVLVVYAQGGSNVPAKFLFDRHRFETVFLHLPPAGRDADIEALLARLPDFDIAFSAVGDGGEGDPFLQGATDFLARLERPILNPPARIPLTARDCLPSLLADIPDLVVPATRRMTRDELEAVVKTAGDGNGPPVLVRPVGSHGGHDLVKLRSVYELGHYLARVPQRAFYASQFVDYRSRDGYHRKYRFLFVDRKVYPYHLAVHDDWLIHYFRAQMDLQPWMKAEEEAFLADWRQVFPDGLGDAVEEVARRLDLDYAGLDCAITRDGRVLVFEANACMLLHLHDSPEAFPYKHRYVPRIVDAMSRLVLGRIDEAGRKR